MLAVTLLAFLCISASANDIQVRSSSYNGEHGGSRGEKFSQSSNQLDGPITANDIQVRSSSYNGEYGGSWGEKFSHSSNQLDGPITAIRVRSDLFYITGLQVRYGQVWSEYVGSKYGNMDEVFLYPEESVVQVSGKYDFYLRELVFVTSNGRHLSFGKNEGISFTAVPLHPNTVLRFISGRADSYIHAIGLHWDLQS